MYEKDCFDLDNSTYLFEYLIDYFRVDAVRVENAQELVQFLEQILNGVSSQLVCRRVKTAWTKSSRLGRVTDARQRFMLKHGSHNEGIEFLFEVFYDALE